MINGPAKQLDLGFNDNFTFWENGQISIGKMFETVKHHIKENNLKLNEISQLKKITFSLFVNKHQQPQNAYEFFENIYCEKELEIYKLINGSRSMFSILEYLDRAFNAFKLKIYYPFTFEMNPEIVCHIEDSEDIPLTSFNLKIFYDGSPENWRYINLKNILSGNSENKEDNQSKAIISIDIPLDDNSVNMIVNIEEGKIEEFLEKLHTRIKDEERKMEFALEVTKNRLFEYVTKQIEKRDLIQKKLFLKARENL